MKTRRILAMLALLLAVLAVSVKADEALVPVINGVSLPSVEEVVPDNEAELPTVELQEEVVEKQDAYFSPDRSEGAPVMPSGGGAAVEPDNGKAEESQDGGWGDNVAEKVETWTEWILEQIVLYRNDIISGAGALAFMVYAALYKKKLVPSVNGLRDKVVGTMANVVDNVQGYIESFSKSLSSQQETWTKDIDAIAEVVKKYESIMQETQQQQTQVLALQQQLAASDARNQVYGQIMRAQVEMVHQSLSSACLLDEQHTANHKAYLKQKEMLDRLDEELAQKTGAVSAVLSQAEDEQTNTGGDAV